MGYEFNQPINLPDNLYIFEFSPNFNQSITLPKSLNHSKSIYKIIIFKNHFLANSDLLL